MVLYYTVTRGERPLVPVARGEIHWYRSKSRRAIGTVLYSNKRRKAIGSSSKRRNPLVQEQE